MASSFLPVVNFLGAMLGLAASQRSGKSTDSMDEKVVLATPLDSSSWGSSEIGSAGSAVWYKTIIPS